MCSDPPSSPEIPLWYVRCPQCGARVEVPEDAIGSDRTDPWNVISCDDCDLAFDYDDQDVQHLAHDLMPESIAKTIPPLYATQDDKDPLARVKWFTPDSNWTWYLTEHDQGQRLCFGLVVGFERELGYFSLDEIEAVRGPLGLRIERDLYFQPCPLSQCG